VPTACSELAKTRNCGSEGEKGKGLFPFSFGWEAIEKRRKKRERGRREGLTSGGLIFVVSVKDFPRRFI